MEKWWWGVLALVAVLLLNAWWKKRQSHKSHKAQIKDLLRTHANRISALEDERRRLEGGLLEHKKTLQDLTAKAESLLEQVERLERDGEQDNVSPSVFDLESLREELRRKTGNLEEMHQEHARRIRNLDDWQDHVRRLPDPPEGEIDRKVT